MISVEDIENAWISMMVGVLGSAGSARVSVPAGMGTISSETVVPGMVWVNASVLTWGMVGGVAGLVAGW